MELPLEMSDTLSMQVSEGTWISLDVTPDGRGVVFELLGDIWRVPIGGGVAEPVLTGPSYDSQPRVSPDGEWMAFISDRDGNDNLWIARIDGSEPKKLTSENQPFTSVISPAWTPDGRYIVATRRRGNLELWMYHVDSGSGFSLQQAGTAGGGESGGTATGLGATVSPDGAYLFYAERRGDAPLPNWQISRRSMSTGETDRITQADGRAFRPAVSPDGTKLIYATRYETETGLRVRDLVTGEDRWLIYPIQRDELETSSWPSRDLLPGLAFTPDGSEIVTTFDGKIWRVNLATGAPIEVSFAADVRLAIGPDLTRPYRLDRGPVRARLVQDPRQSPDGTRVAFSVLTKLYVMELPDGQPRRLTAADAREFKPVWSPDGAWIAYVTWEMDGGYIWRARADGSGSPRRLTERKAFYTDLMFSADGKRIVGLRGSAFQRQQTASEFAGLGIPLDLVWLDAEGGDINLVSPARGLRMPHVGPEADRIYVYTPEGLVSLRYDGSDRRTHLRVIGLTAAAVGAVPAQAVVMRPDGKWALAMADNQLYVLAVPPVGGDGARVSLQAPNVPAQRLTDIGADYFAWADGGATITWAIGSTYFRRPFDSVEFVRRGPSDPPRAGGAEGRAGEPRDADPSVESFPVAIEFERAVPEGTVVIANATLITMDGDGLIDRGDIVVTGDRIAAIGPSGKVRIPPGARVYDATGQYVVPGFIDTHAHWAFRVQDVLEPQNWSLAANLAYGVTAGLDPQPNTSNAFAYQDLIETGQSIGTRLFTTGPGVFWDTAFRTYEGVYSYLRRYKEYYGTPNIKSYLVGPRRHRQYVAMASRELGLMPTTEGGRDMKLDITHAIDGMHGNEHTLPVLPLYDDVIQLFARTRTAYTPALLFQYGAPAALAYWLAREEVHDDQKLNRFYPHNLLDVLTRRLRRWARDDEYAFAEAAAQAAKIQRAGGLVGVGGHGELQGLGYHWEMWSLAAGGMTPLEVLQAATIDGARIIGFDQDLGSLRVGKLADLVVLERNPLENIRNTNTVRWVMKNGELYEGDTLTRIWPSRRELGPFWWWDAQPERRGGS